MSSKRTPLPGGETGAAGFGAGTALGSRNARAHSPRRGAAPPARGVPDVLSEDDSADGIELDSPSPAAAPRARATAAGGRGTVASSARPVLSLAGAVDPAHPFGEGEDEAGLTLHVWQPPASVVGLHRELFLLRGADAPFESPETSVVWEAPATGGAAAATADAADAAGCGPGVGSQAAGVADGGGSGGEGEGHASAAAAAEGCPTDASAGTAAAPPPPTADAAHAGSGFRILISTLRAAQDVGWLERNRVSLVVSILDDQTAPGEVAAAAAAAGGGAGESLARGSSGAGSGQRVADGAKTASGPAFDSDMTLLRRAIAECPSVTHHLCFDLRDCDDARGAMLQVFRVACDAIDRCKQRGETALVHCRAGVSRSPAVVVAWMLRQGLLFEDAVSRVRSARPQVLPNYGFWASLLRWAEATEASSAATSGDSRALTGAGSGAGMAIRPRPLMPRLSGFAETSAGGAGETAGAMGDVTATGVASGRAKRQSLGVEGAGGYGGDAGVAGFAQAGPAPRAAEPRGDALGREEVASAAELSASEAGPGPQEAGAFGSGSGSGSKSRRMSVQRPSSASLPHNLRYSDAAADRMARRVADRLGITLEASPASKRQRGSRLPSSSADEEDNASRPPRPSTSSSAGQSLDEALGGRPSFRADTPDSMDSSPAGKSRPRLVAGPGGASLALDLG